MEKYFSYFSNFADFPDIYIDKLLEKYNIENKDSFTIFCNNYFSKKIDKLFRKIKKRAYYLTSIDSIKIFINFMNDEINNIYDKLSNEELNYHNYSKHVSADNLIGQADLLLRIQSDIINTKKIVLKRDIDKLKFIKDTKILNQIELNKTLNTDTINKINLLLDKEINKLQDEIEKSYENDKNINYIEVFKNLIYLWYNFKKEFKYTFRNYILSQDIFQEPEHFFKSVYEGYFDVLKDSINKSDKKIKSILLDTNVNLMERVKIFEYDNISHSIRIFLNGIDNHIVKFFTLQQYKQYYQCEIKNRIDYYSNTNSVFNELDFIRSNFSSLENVFADLEDSFISEFKLKSKKNIPKYISDFHNDVYNIIEKFISERLKTIAPDKTLKDILTDNPLNSYIKWNKGKADFVELIQALYITNSIRREDNQALSKKEFVDFMGKVFNFPIKSFDTSLKSAEERKRENNRFLKELNTKYLEEIEKKEEKNRSRK